MKKVTASQVATAEETSKKDLPESVQAALGDLAGAAKDALPALSVGVGLSRHARAVTNLLDGIAYPGGMTSNQATVLSNRSW